MNTNNWKQVLGGSELNKDFKNYKMQDGEEVPNQAKFTGDKFPGSGNPAKKELEAWHRDNKVFEADKNVEKETPLGSSLMRPRIQKRFDKKASRKKYAWGGEATEEIHPQRYLDGYVSILISQNISNQITKDNWQEVCAELIERYSGVILQFPNISSVEAVRVQRLFFPQQFDLILKVIFETPVTQDDLAIFKKKFPNCDAWGGDSISPTIASTNNWRQVLSDVKFNRTNDGTITLDYAETGSTPNSVSNTSQSQSIQESAETNSHNPEQTSEGNQEGNSMSGTASLRKKANENSYDSLGNILTEGERVRNEEGRTGTISVLDNTGNARVEWDDEKENNATNWTKNFPKQYPQGTYFQGKVVPCSTLTKWASKKLDWHQVLAGEPDINFKKKPDGTFELNVTHPAPEQEEAIQENIQQQEQATDQAGQTPTATSSKTSDVTEWIIKKQGNLVLLGRECDTCVGVFIAKENISKTASKDRYDIRASEKLDKNGHTWHELINQSVWENKFLDMVKTNG